MTKAITLLALVLSLTGCAADAQVFKAIMNATAFSDNQQEDGE